MLFQSALTSPCINCAFLGVRKKLDHQYHFSCQFTADLIAMNASDFIITSTFQEIAGDADTVGAYLVCHGTWVQL